MAEFYSVKAPNFLHILYIFILKLLDLHGIFYAKNDRTIKYLKCCIKQVSLKSII